MKLMDRAEIVRLHNMALGEALYASTLAEAAFGLAVNGLPRDKTVDIIDQVILVLERHQASTLGGPGAIEHARARLEGLLSVYAKKQGL